MQLKIINKRRAALVDAVREIIYELYEGSDEELESATERIVAGALREILTAAEWQEEEIVEEDDDDDDD
ncbi:MAG TPA: hypothetical protein VGE07_06115 [Herpetosiphonaceae bacterium]